MDSPTLNIWQKLKKPFTVLAPMDDVTDIVFRAIVNQTARPDVFFTEFTSVEALCSSGRQANLRRLTFSEDQRPIIGQIWGTTPDFFRQSAQLLVELGFDGIDINMGCPVRDVIKMGACSGLMKHPERAAEIIAATRAGAGNLPISVKTRIGLKDIQTEEWIGFLLKQNLDAITIHGRTVAELSKVPAHWDEIEKAVELKNNIAPRTIIIGNGDVADYANAQSKAQEFGVDGVMIGRGIFNNPWAFSSDPREHSIEEKLNLLLDHLHLFIKTYGETRRFETLKRFFKIYVSGFDGAAELRANLMLTSSQEEVEKVIADFRSVQSHA